MQKKGKHIYIESMRTKFPYIRSLLILNCPFLASTRHQLELTGSVHDDVGGEHIDIIPPASYARTVPVEHARRTDCVEAIDVDVAGSLDGDDA